MEKISRRFGTLRTIISVLTKATVS